MNENDVAANQVSDVADKVAETISRAVDHVAPIVRTMVRETAMEGWTRLVIMTGVGLGFLLLTWLVARFVLRNVEEWESITDRMAAKATTVILALVITGITAGVTINGVLDALHRAVAPTVYLAEKLRDGS